MYNYEIKITYRQIQDDGLDKKIAEIYIVKAYSLYEAIEVISGEFGHMTDFEVESGKKSKVTEIIYNDDSTEYGDYTYFNAKIYFITLDEKSGKEKKTTNTTLVRANNLNEARLLVEKVMKDSISDYSIGGVVDTKIIDVIEGKGGN